MLELNVVMFELSRHSRAHPTNTEAMELGTMCISERTQSDWFKCGSCFCALERGHEELPSLCFQD